MTFIAALRHDRIEAPWLLNGPVNGERFRVYVDRVLVPTLRPDDIVVMDNLGSHKSKAVRQAIRGALIDGARPADALRRANRVLLRSDNPGVVTAIVGIIDPATLQFRYAGAGHPSPLLASSDDECTTLPGSGTGIVIFNQTNRYTFAPSLSGSLSVVQEGSGTTVLTGSNTYTGTTTVTRGTLMIGSNCSR